MSDTKILLVAASLLEVESLINSSCKKQTPDLYTVLNFNADIDLLITGIGVTSMTYFLTKQLLVKDYSFAILVGIAGSYHKSIELGSVVNVSSERFADLGVIENDSFTDLFDMGLQEANSFPFENKYLKNYTLINNETINKLPSFKGNTVNSIRTEILPYIQKNTDIESMEGASFAFVCAHHPMPYVHLRAISNYVGQQDKKYWNIPLAVENLDITIRELLQEII